MEDVTLSRAHPNLPKIVSLFVHNGEAVIAACHHACLNAWTRFNLWLKVIPHDAVVLEFQTEFTDGVFIETVNSSKSLDSAENVRMERLPPETRPEALLGAHRAAVEEYAASHPDAYPIRITNYEDLIGSQHRQTASEHEHRDRIGYISEDEIVGCARAGEKPIAKAMYAATQTLHKQKTHTDHRQAVERGAID